MNRAPVPLTLPFTPGASPSSCSAGLGTGGGPDAGGGAGAGGSAGTGGGGRRRIAL